MWQEDGDEEDTKESPPLRFKRTQARLFDHVSHHQDGRRGIVTGVVDKEDGVRLLHVAWVDGTWSDVADDEVKVVDLTRLKWQRS